MAKWVLDTNVFIAAIRNAAVRSELADWQRRMAPHLYQHAIVTAEILVGARTERIRKQWHARWIAPAECVGRIVVPVYGTWLKASAVVTRLVELKEITPGSMSAGFFNDCVIAVSCRELGHTVVTHNLADFRRIAKGLPGLKISKPLP